MHKRASEDQIKQYAYIYDSDLVNYHASPLFLKLIAQLLAEREESNRLRKELSELKDASLAEARENVSSIFRNLAKDLP
jgi:hypothetical protein